MIITANREELDIALNNSVSLCILIGTQDSLSGKLHANLDTGTWGNEPWQSWFLVTDRNILSGNEKEKWFSGNDAFDYVFLGRNTKVVASNGIVGNDLFYDDECDYITCIEKFAEADLK